MISEVIYFSNNKNWIIGAIARETIGHANRKIDISFIANSRILQLNPRNFYQSQMRRSYTNVLFLGASTLFTILERHPDARLFGCRVFFTHLISEGAATPKQVEALNKLDKIFTMNASSRKILIDVGVTREIVVVYGAVDHEIFYPSHTRDKDCEYVLISSHAVPRKRPELILEFIEDSPDLNFLIHGKFWDQYVTSHIKNLEIRKFDFLKQPILMRKAAVFLSLSWVEGGPFPILEALASGTPVVSTSTGFAPDLLGPEIGRLIEDSSDFALIRESLQQCIALKSSTYDRNLLPYQLSWKELAQHFFDEVK